MGVLSALKSRGMDIAPAAVIRTAKKARDKWLDYRDRDSALRQAMAADATALAAATAEQLSSKEAASLPAITPAPSGNAAVEKSAGMTLENA